MGRIGVNSQQELLDLYEAILSTSNFIVDGIFTHFATADEEDSLYFDNQVHIFNELLNALPTKPRIVHAANTATALTKDTSLQFDAVRFGISMYGLLPSTYVGGILPFPLRPAFSLRNRVSSCENITCRSICWIWSNVYSDRGLLCWHNSDWLCRWYDS